MSKRTGATLVTLTSLLLAFFFGGRLSVAQQGASYPPVIVQAVNVVSDASGNWTVSWSQSFQSSSPFVAARAVIPIAGNPINCEVATRTAGGATGWCRQSTPALLNLSIITTGLTLNPFLNVPATNTAIMVIGRDTTQ